MDAPPRTPTCSSSRATAVIPGRTRSGTQRASWSTTRRARWCWRGRPTAPDDDGEPPRRSPSRSRNPSPMCDASQAARPQPEYVRSVTLPPGPSRPAPRCHTAGWVTRPGPYTRRLRAALRRHVHAARRPPAPWVMSSHPDDVKHVFTGDPNVLHAGEGNAILKPLLGAEQRAAARRPGAHGRAQGDAAAVPRRAHAGLRRADPRDRRARGRDAGRRASRSPPARACRR